MRIVNVVAAMLFGKPVVAQGVKLPSVTNSIGMELIEIPAGKFTMGSPEDEKDHCYAEAQVTVTLTKPFGLGKTEVTQGQWKRLMGTVPWDGQSFVKADKDCPATFVSYFDAVEFCEKLTELERESGKLSENEEYRLPTEAEWEYACRAGTTTTFSFGDDESKLGKYAWFDGNALNVDEQYAHKVGLKKPNPWGLHDMHGNVWEWCSDWADSTLQGGTDPVGPEEGSSRVMRGGGWGSDPGRCRAANRNGYDPSDCRTDLVFRVARSQSETVTLAERRQQGAQAKPAPQVAVETRPGMEKSEPVGKVFKGEIVTNSIGMELIELPAGKFTMGSPEDEKFRQDRESQVSVTLAQPFGLGKYEVTQGQWKSVMGTEPWEGQQLVQADKDCPATFVSYFDAVEFCEKLTEIERESGKLKAGEEYRLPTEAEWEYACRAGTETAFSFGDESKLNSYAWWSGLDSVAASKGEQKAGGGNAAREQYAHKVGLKKLNPWGLHDMHGNVFEWCSDWYGDKLSGGTDPVGPKEGSSRVLRGGSWGNDPDYCRSAARGYVDPSRRNNNLGFRVARSQSETVTLAERRQQGAQAKPAPQVAVETRPGMEKSEPVGKVFKGEIVTNSIGMELIELPAGKFTMGSPEDEKFRQDRESQVSVTLAQPFGLGKYEVTQGQWKSVMGTEPWDGQKYVQADKDCPATFVSYFDAVEFCEKLTELERESGKLKANEEYRLPTEAEWEYACRAGTTTAFSFGDESKLNSHTWWGGFDLEALMKGEIKAGGGNAAREQYAHKVGMKKPNPWGLHDMHGNVWEWCSDWDGDALSGGTDPVGPNGGSSRLARGGCWFDYPPFCRSAYRNFLDPSLRYSSLGFRVARSQSETVTLAERRQQGAQAKPAPQVAVETRPKMKKTDSVKKVFESGESLTNSIGMELIEIPAGKFTMGSPEDEKFRKDRESQVSVTLAQPFGLGKYEVTQGQWKSVMGTEPWEGEGLVQADKDCPATFVSYFDAVEFCEKLTDLERKSGKLKANEEYRLPTEAEWEYACRAGTETAFSFGDESKLNSHAWWAGNALNVDEQYAHKVGLKKPNPWGLHDIHGNVWEWCSDWADTLQGGTDPVGPNGGSFRVFRGGGWGSIPGGCRSADCGADDPSYRDNYLGFRVARSQSATVTGAERRQQGAQAKPAPQVAVETRPGMEKPEPVRKVFKSGESVTNSIGMVLIEILAGTFTMGSPEDEKDRSDNEAQASVTLTKPFGLGKYEVTQGQWKSVMGTAPWWKKMMGTEPWKGKQFVQADKDCPATCVSWDDATDFCKKLTEIERKSGTLKAGEEYRLPTEAEWEYACRAGTETAFSFGDESKLNSHAWWGGCDLEAASKGGIKAGPGNAAREQYAHKVGLKKPNPWGLHDMHGNVDEWCSDWDGNALSGGTDPAGPEEGSSRVVRGGSWWGPPGCCRSADRYYGVPSSRNGLLGFRVARSQSAQ